MAAIDTKSATFTVGGDEYASQVSSFTVDSGEASGGFVSFASAAAGGAREYVVKITLCQDASAAVTGVGGQPIWDLLWTHVSEVVDVVYRPYGNSVATPSQPHFHCSCRITEPNSTILGGSADPGSGLNTVDVEWTTTTGRPTKVTS
jgi:hypothetical protein